MLSQKKLFHIRVASTRKTTKRTWQTERDWSGWRLFERDNRVLSFYFDWRIRKKVEWRNSWWKLWVPFKFGFDFCVQIFLAVLFQLSFLIFSVGWPDWALGSCKITGANSWYAECTWFTGSNGKPQSYQESYGGIQLKNGCSCAPHQRHADLGVLAEPSRNSSDQWISAGQHFWLWPKVFGPTQGEWQQVFRNEPDLLPILAVALKVTCYSQSHDFQRSMQQEKRIYVSKNETESIQKCRRKISELESGSGLSGKLSSGSYLKIGGHQEFMTDFSSVVRGFRNDNTLGVKVHHFPTSQCAFQSQRTKFPSMQNRKNVKCLYFRLRRNWISIPRRWTEREKRSEQQTSSWQVSDASLDV